MSFWANHNGCNPELRLRQETNILASSFRKDDDTAEVRRDLTHNDTVVYEARCAFPLLPC